MKGALIFDVLISVTIGLVIAAVVYAIVSYNKISKTLEEKTSEYSSTINGVESTMKSFAKDVDTKFAYYAHDPYAVITTESSTDQASKSISVNGTTNSSINLGKAQIMFDDNSQSLSISNKYGNSRLALFPDSIEINATSVNIGVHNLKATPDGLVFCKFGKNCKTVLS
eukprot:gene19706-26397_t